MRTDDLFVLLGAVGVTPDAFFAELYGLFPREERGAEVAPGVYEGPIRRFVEEVARRAAYEVVERRAHLHLPATAGPRREVEELASRP